MVLEYVKIEGLAYGFMLFWVWSWKMLFWGWRGQIGVNLPYVFPCSPVPLALGLYEVTAWHGSLVGYGPWYVLTVDRRPEKNPWPGERSGRA